MFISDDIKSEILKNLDSGNKLQSVLILKNYSGKTLKECQQVIDDIERDYIPEEKDIVETDGLKIILKKFYETNKEFLNLLIPFDKWNYNNILFSTNENIKGKIFFKIDSVEFKLKQKVWAPYNMPGKRGYDSPHWKEEPLEKIKNGEFIFPIDANGEMLYKKIANLSKSLNDYLEDKKLQKQNIEKEKEKILREEKKRIEEEKERLKEEERKRLELINFQKLTTNKNQFLNELDKDSDGVVDLVDCSDFNKLLQKHQKKIIEVEKKYVQNFVKISIYLKTKKQNITSIFNSINESKDNKILNRQVQILGNLKQQIHSYDSLLFHSISMVTSVVHDDLITFYEIYECFDQLGVFNSNWENEVSNNLSDIGSKLDEIGVQLEDFGDRLNDLLDSINSMESNIVNSLDNLSYITEDSFKELNSSVKEELSSIDSSIKFNNLLTGIQTYQLYKINTNTKRIN